MRILPILFNTAMVRAILDDRKNVTRRVVKPQPNGTFDQHWGGFYKDNEWILLKEPYHPGDILYVRETWAYGCTFATERKLFYRADGDSGDVYRWRPSIHMPREAARIFLRVTDVRVERLRNITADDALREGVKPLSETPKGCRACGPGVPHYPECSYELCGNYKSFEYERAVLPFIEVWNGTIKPADRDRFGWDANPWVRRVEFERCEKPEEPQQKKEEPKT